MERKYANADEALAVAKEAIWLAWNACGGPRHMGVLQDNPGAQKEQVWKQAYEQRDCSMRHGGPESVSADYVFGRMMKLRFKVLGDTIKIPDGTPRADYQSWCFAYSSYAALFDAAESVLTKSAA